ncbi:MAG: hypothetical protein QXQ29_03860 [Candidatus Bathyarchaeia archaeon]
MLKLQGKLMNTALRSTADKLEVEAILSDARVLVNKVGEYLTENGLMG